MYYVDLGPVFEKIEADFARTYVLGAQPLPLHPHEEYATLLYAEKCCRLSLYLRMFGFALGTREQGGEETLFVTGSHDGATEGMGVLPLWTFSLEGKWKDCS